jgi:hypothetical protein
VWEENIKMGFKETGREDVDWINLGKDKAQWQAVVNTVMDLWVPYKMGNFFTIWAAVCLLSVVLHGVSSIAAAAAFMLLCSQK